MNLIEIAKQAQHNAYAPYSKVKVGAALLTEENKIYQGANIENLRFGELICAERNALYTALGNGEHQFKEMVIIANYRGELKPCRLCRSAIAEHCPDLKIKTINLNTNKTLHLSLPDLYQNKFQYELRSAFRMLIRKIIK